MPASASALTSGSSWPNNGKWRWMAALAVAAVVAVAGCDGDDEIDEETAERHAELQAVYHADVTAVAAREMVLLHPGSERQRQAREQLLFLERFEDGGIDSAALEDDEHEQLDGQSNQPPTEKEQ